MLLYHHKVWWRINIYENNIPVTTVEVHKSDVGARGTNLESFAVSPIVNVARESDLQVQVGHINKESNHHITARLNRIKKEFKSCAGRPLKTKKIGESDSFEVITTSSFSHFKTYKVCYTKTFEVS